MRIIKLVKNLFAFTIFCLFSFAANAQSLRIGLIDYPPHISLDEDITKSPLYQYIHKLLLPLDITLEYVKLPRERASFELKKGRIDLLMPIPLDTENKKLLSAPIFHSVPGLCFKKKNFIPILSATHRFENLAIGVPLN